jgi:hypothetical protein
MALQLSRSPSASFRALPNSSLIFSFSSTSGLSPLHGTVCHPATVFTTQHSFIYGLVNLFWPVAKIRWRAWCARIRTLSLSPAVREAAACKFLDDLSPVSQNPLDWTIVTKAWAGACHILSSTILHSSSETLCYSYPFVSLFSQASMTATTIYTSVIRLIPR